MEEYEQLEAECEAIKEKADKARADFYKGSKTAGKNGAANDEEEPTDIPF